MKASILVKIDDNDIKSAGLDYESVLDILIEAMARECEHYRLDFDFGYNPEHITNGIAS